MVFEGKTASTLCRHLKDLAQKGGKAIEESLYQARQDPLVLWGLNPGDGRTLPPLSHGESSAKLKQWAQNGATCHE